MARHDRISEDQSAEPATALPDPPTHAVIDRWYEDTFTNIGLDDQLSNRVRAAVARLKDLIAATR